MNKTIRTIAGLFAALLLFIASNVIAQDARLAEIDSYIESARKNWEVPGVAVAIVKDNALIFAKGYGTRTIGKNEPVDENTLFAVASNSKAFTVALLGLLVDEGRLRWDDRVIDYLPHFQMHDPYVTREMTIRDLVTHRSGLPTYGGDHLWIGNDLSQEEILSRLRYLQPVGLFRSSYHYQNLMFLVAGMVYEKISGEAWDVAVAKHFLQPLGMSRSNSTIRELAGDANVATPHEQRDGKTVTVSYEFLDNVAPAAALNATAKDMSQWMLLNLNGGKFADRQIISEDVVREMQAIHNPLAISKSSEALLNRKFLGAGMGWFVTNYEGYKLINHGGGMSGMISLQTMVPEAKFGVMVMTNYAPTRLTTALTYYILDVFFKADSTVRRDWSAYYLEQAQKNKAEEAEEAAKLQASRIKNTRPALPLEALTGSYFEPFSGAATVRLENGKLVFDYNPRHLGDLEHWHYNTFRVIWRDPIFDMPAKTFLTFELNEKGEVTALKTHFYDPITFTKTPENTGDR